MLKIKEVKYVMLETGGEWLRVYGEDATPYERDNEVIIASKYALVKITDINVCIGMEPGVYACDDEGTMTVVTADSLKPIDLPKNIAEKFKYAAMDADHMWYASPSLPIIRKPSCEWEWEADNRVRMGILFDIETPAGYDWKQSLHKREEDGSWKKLRL